MEIKLHGVQHWPEDFVTLMTPHVVLLVHLRHITSGKAGKTDILHFKVFVNHRIVFSFHFNGLTDWLVQLGEISNKVISQCILFDTVGCEYGDRANGCEGAIRSHLDCYVNGGVCCETCAQYETGDPGKILIKQNCPFLEEKRK